MSLRALGDRPRLRFLVIGGGVTGCFLSYYLLRDGHAVTLVDRPKQAVRTSVYNGGVLSASSTFTSLFTPDATATMSPSELRRHPRWFEIARRRGRVAYDMVIPTLASESIGLYRQFLSAESAHVDLIEVATRLYLETEDAEEDTRRTGGKFVGVRELLGMGYKGFEGGVIGKTASLHPGKLLEHLQTRLAEMGVRKLCGAVRLRGSGSHNIECAVLDDGELHADAYVVAAGSWSSDLCRPLGYDPHILPARGLVLIYDTHGRRVVDCPATYQDEGVSLTQHDARTLRMTGFFELSGFDSRFNRRKRDWLSNAATSHFSRNLRLTSTEVGVGFRPCTPDQLPVVGKIPGCDNGYIVSGSGRKGVVLSPVLARLTLGCALGRGDGLDIMLKPLDPARFD
jgi:D-amino-acid dehydrogenase